MTGRSRNHRRRPDRRTASPLFLVSTGCFVTASDILAGGQLARVAAADLAWQITFADWQARAPRRWQRSGRARWLAEFEALVEERSRIAEIAQFYGMPDQSLDGR